MIAYYQAKKEKHQETLQRTQQQLNWLSGIRFLVFVTTFFVIYLFWGHQNIMIASSILGIIVFIFLLNKYLKLTHQKKRLQKLVLINSTEIAYLERNYSTFDTGEEFINAKHFFSYDIDLFGQGSFFHFINRTATKQGKFILSTLLTNNNIDNVTQKQETIKELSQKSDWRQLFSATASLIEITTPVDSILKWIEEHKPLFSKKNLLLTNIFSSISVILIIVVSFDFLEFSYLITWFFIGVLISGFYFKKVNIIHQHASQTTATFQQYYKILELIENEQFSTDELLKKQKKLSSENQKASDVFKAFSKILDALDQRNNILLAIIRNGLFLSDLKQASKIEIWILQHKNITKEWFDIIAFFDAQNSLANFKFNHSEFVFPKILTEENMIKTKDLGHPLIHAEKRITNNYTIDAQSFFIITGSNMAGKSTFLRTVALNIVMANIGLPVCASSMAYKPIKLITSMRTSDSLTDNTSYFFAEIKRLKFIINTIKDEPYFILLDEILKGTNSVDKANGSQKFVEKLIASKATGIIATHDLSLCSIADTHSEIRNYYFDSEITKNELVFDYKLKKGICKNMNASFLLKKMEII
ncbi:MutS-related protein [Wenyingzhuangia sp. 2_MG-2023]|uniref:MutS-related protein n=1 Tax=Wenyingzhuangia sp. 2_MG-2023 TaxID=3062639 RepID=UPI0026E1B22E|nr:DNA mismatch repair protein MutS [Wenyingzhuangia sp. 2_MG-2023]MDO6736467.1 DNA mismatch repair protein MutS [Wenyingzhuangia sp. 2_MG-2023]